ncbi:hypothetical protein [Candidatus Coxiella mudrowiae]|uniref:hypothetical protein n=1 Tax=Candidatus Coxiella mudrowiae TaxID=2054173 RepID=UPI001F40736F|nr:hypothetical protein [Candidatus Coxiella mudrowiae]
MKVNKYGVFKKIKSKSPEKPKKNFMNYFGISYIEPELIENYGEIEAALKHQLLKLITLIKIFEGICIFIQKLPTDATPLKK